jgi:hypothetical protein
MPAFVLNHNSLTTMNRQSHPACLTYRGEALSTGGIL